MDRRIIVLTESEWANRESLLEAAKRADQHNHYNKDAQLAIKSIVYIAEVAIKAGDTRTATEELAKIPDICRRIYTDSCRAQDGVGDLVTLLEHKAKEEAKENAANPIGLILRSGDRIRVNGKEYEAFLSMGGWMLAEVEEGDSDG